MEQNKLDLTLKLKPIQTNTNSDVASDDAWLQNNDKNLLQDYSSDGSAALNSVVEKLSNNDAFNKQTYQVSEIIIKEAAGTYQLHMPHGTTNLENGDVIVTGIGAFEVTIEKKQIIVNPDPKVESTYAMANAVDDIWSSPIQTPHASVMNQAHVDPLLMNPMAQSQALDPLTFLYGEAQTITPNQSLPGVIPQATGMGALPYDPIAAMGSPMPAMPGQQHTPPHEQDGLNIHTGSEFQPSHTVQNALHNSQVPSSGAGDILQDLGMTEQSSAIANIHTAEQMPMASTQHALTEQSPIDMLDEYLGEDPLMQDQNMMHGMQMPTNQDFTSMPMRGSMQRAQESSLLGTIKGFKKKILG